MIPTLFILFLAVSPSLGQASSVREIDLQGHRGGRGLLPENSIPAFRLCFQYGMDTIELDTVLTLDDVLMVYHDTEVNTKLCLNAARQRPPAQAVRQVTAEYMQSLDCGSLRNPAFSRQQTTTGARPITLTRFFQWVSRYETTVEGRKQLMRFNIEVKIPTKADAKEITHTAEVLQKTLDEAGLDARLSIQCFNLEFLKAIGALKPNLPRVALFTPTTLVAKDLPGQQREMIEKAKGVGAAVISPFHRMVTAAWVGEVHQAGLKVIPWTVNVGRTMDELYAMGVDGLISDYPNRLEDARKRWRAEAEAGNGAK